MTREAGVPIGTDHHEGREEHEVGRWTPLGTAVSLDPRLLLDSVAQSFVPFVIFVVTCPL